MDKTLQRWEWFDVETITLLAWINRAINSSVWNWILFLLFWRECNKIICAKYTMFEIWDRDCHIFCGCLTQYRTTAKLFKWAPTPIWCDTCTRVTLVTPPSNLKKMDNIPSFTKVGRKNEQDGCQNRRRAEMWMEKIAKVGWVSK